MNLSAPWLLMLPGLLAAAAGVPEAPKLVQASTPQRVFAGEGRDFMVTWQNTGSKPVTVDLQMRLVQTSTWTATVIGDAPWKKLTVLPGQTVLEHATLDFPDVKAETRFLVRWLEGTNRTFGTTEVLVYPTNLLAELKLLAGEDQPVGVFDPDNTLKPLLKALRIAFEDLEDLGVAGFQDKLAIIGPFSSREQLPGDLAERIEKLARKGTGVVWLQPPPAPRDKLQPTFQTVPLGPGAVVLVQPQLVRDLGRSPEAQLNLIRLSQLACNPEPRTLPNPNPQP